ncbi:hypothetical protein J6590_058400 [Homalodisca vitripennis]|nr:hypothetical protein J6590_058400 [Homalodisca vitripennis]
MKLHNFLPKEVRCLTKRRLKTALTDWLVNNPFYTVNEFMERRHQTKLFSIRGNSFNSAVREPYCFVFYYSSFPPAKKRKAAVLISDPPHRSPSPVFSLTLSAEMDTMPPTQPRIPPHYRVHSTLAYPCCCPTSPDWLYTLLLPIPRHPVALLLVIYGDYLNLFKKKSGCAVVFGGTGNNQGRWKDFLDTLNSVEIPIPSGLWRASYGLGNRDSATLLVDKVWFIFRGIKLKPLRTQWSNNFRQIPKTLLTVTTLICGWRLSIKRLLMTIMSRNFHPSLMLNFPPPNLGCGILDGFRMDLGKLLIPIIFVLQPLNNSRNGCCIGSAFPVAHLLEDKDQHHQMVYDPVLREVLIPSVADSEGLRQLAMNKTSSPVKSLSKGKKEEWNVGSSSRGEETVMIF